MPLFSPRSSAAGSRPDLLSKQSTTTAVANDSSWQRKKGRGSVVRETESSQKELSQKLDQQQLKSFTKWWNSWLVEVGLKVEDLCEDVKPGVLSIRLLEVLSDSSCGKFNKNPKTQFQHFENHNIFLKQLAAKSIKLVNIGAEDLAGTTGTADSQRKLVLGLTWTLILRYEIHQFGGNETELLAWAKATANEETGNTYDGNWSDAFRHGQAFCGLVASAEPEAIDLESTAKMSDKQAMEVRAPARRARGAFAARSRRVPGAFPASWHRSRSDSLRSADLAGNARGGEISPQRHRSRRDSLRGTRRVGMPCSERCRCG